MRIGFILIPLFLLLASCTKSEFILQNVDFTTGNWLLVNDSDSAIEIIVDEKILAANKNGIWVTPMGDCGGTTCDGLLKLYKDGKLVAQKGYLTRTVLYESKEIKEAYQKGKEWTIEPLDKNDFDKKWDSLLVKHNYPTIYNSQPSNKDIIWVYTFD